MRYGDSGTLFTTDGEAPIWLDEVKFAEDAQAAGAGIQAITYGSAGDARAQRYARGTFLMAWDGGDGGALSFRTNETGSEWQPNWTTDVGVPTSRRKAVGQGFIRNFSTGIVLVNPGSSGSQDFDLGGSYSDPDSGSCVSSVRLGATRASSCRSAERRRASTPSAPRLRSSPGGLVHSDHRRDARRGDLPRLERRRCAVRGKRGAALDRGPPGRRRRGPLRAQGLRPCRRRGPERDPHDAPGATSCTPISRSSTWLRCSPAGAGPGT